MTKLEPPFNPLDKRSLGASVAKALLARPVALLPPEDSFVGAGVYAIYYVGDFAAYSALAEANKPDRHAVPIYVGKAIPPGARRGGVGLDENPGQVLYKRLREHAESISQSENLQLSDFRCRYLVADDIWIPLGESLLINMFSPVWNRVIDGFGNHSPGAGRQNQRKSPWDVLHPGRQWAQSLPAGDKTCDDLDAIVRRFLEEHASKKSNP